MVQIELLQLLERRNMRDPGVAEIDGIEQQRLQLRQSCQAGQTRIADCRVTEIQRFQIQKLADLCMPLSVAIVFCRFSTRSCFSAGRCISPASVKRVKLRLSTSSFVSLLMLARPASRISTPASSSSTRFESADTGSSPGSVTSE